MAFRLLAYLQGECQLILRSFKCLITNVFGVNLRNAQPVVPGSCWNYLPQAG